MRDKGVGSPVTIVAPERAAEYRRYYYAAVTWSDHMLGKALDRLEAMGPAVSGRTVTIFHSDHGYLLRPIYCSRICVWFSVLHMFTLYGAGISSVS